MVAENSGQHRQVSGRVDDAVFEAIQAEAMPEFEVDFIISARRRNLPRDYVDVVIARCKGFRKRI
jgi:hypothetical protein